MKITLNQIAAAAGVSRGTVDRALNNRGRVNPEVAKRIINLAEEMGYHRNLAGRALALSRSDFKIGVIVQSADTPFMKNVLEGVNEAKNQVQEFGFEVLIRKIEGVSSSQAIKAMDELRDLGCSAIALIPSSDPEFIEKVNSFTEEGIPVITFNSDIEDSSRQCFVGQDSYQSGKTAGGLMAEILPFDASCLIISGYPDFRSHAERTDGFCEELSKARQDVKILPIEYAHDDDALTESITSNTLKTLKSSDYLGIYLSAAGLKGACKALSKYSGANRVKVISNDLTEGNCRRLRQGAVNFLIGQDAHTQGYEPVMMLFHQLFEKKPARREPLYTDISIKTRYNI